MAEPEKTNPEQNKDQEDKKLGKTGEKKKRSRIFAAFMHLFELGVYAMFVTLLTISIFTLDFLDITQFRYRLPDEWRKTWPLSKYYDFVAFHQLPDEQRFQKLIHREKQRYHEAITRDSAELQRRSKALEDSFQQLTREQEQFYQKRQTELGEIEQNLLKRKDEIEKLEEKSRRREEALNILYQQLASETINLEAGLIRFMEGDNRLAPIQDIATVMDPRALATILGEIGDNTLIFRILSGIPPERSGLILAAMDPEKAGKIVTISQRPIQLPPPGTMRPYIPPALSDLIASVEANLR